jgi:hypothetical protein
LIGEAAATKPPHVKVRLDVRRVQGDLAGAELSEGVVTPIKLFGRFERRGTRYWTSWFRACYRWCWRRSRVW